MKEKPNKKEYLSYEANQRKKIHETPLLDREEELMLIKKWQETGCLKSREKIIHAYQKLIHKRVKDYQKKSINSSITYQDLVSEANIGLMKAIDNFNPENDNRLGTYASWQVYSSMQVFTQENAAPVKAKRKKKEIDQSDDNPTDKHKTVISYPLHYSLQNILNDDGTNTTYQDTIVDERVTDDTLIGSIVKEQRTKFIENLIQNLKPKEQYVILQRFKTDNQPPLKEVASAINEGLTPERVRQIESTAIAKLHKAAKKSSIKFIDLFA